MHEFSVMSQVVDLILREAERRSAERVEHVNLDVGEFTFLAEEQLRFAFEILTRETIAEGAKLDVTRTSGTVECECGYVGEPEHPEEVHVLVPLLKCPECGKIARVKGGTGCSVRDISLVVPDVQA